MRNRLNKAGILVVIKRKGTWQSSEPRRYQNVARPLKQKPPDMPPEGFFVLGIR